MIKFQTNLRPTKLYRILMRRKSLSALINGKWVKNAELTSAGKSVPTVSQFRNSVKADGSSEFKAEANRYHLYVSYACPWSHRATIFRKIKGLENVISVSNLDVIVGENGWGFGKEGDITKDPLYGVANLHEIYTKAKPDITSKVTLPVLWDKHKETIVNNESSEIMRMLNSEFKDFADPKAPDFFPKELRPQINKINVYVLKNINLGVYDVGLATNQSAYDEAFDKLFAGLDHVDNLLANQPYLVGDHMTEGDWRLFVTLIRFDAVHVGHFMCNLRRIVDYKNLSRYMKEMYDYPGVKDTVNFHDIKRHFYLSQKHFNPVYSGVVPKGPQIDL